MMYPDDDPFESIKLPKGYHAAQAPAPKPPAARPAPAPSRPAPPPAPKRGEPAPDNGLPRIEAKQAAEVCQRFEPSDEAKALLRDELTPRQYLELLTKHQHYQDAIKFLAHALPKREAVWWACVCARRVSGAAPPPKVAAALQAAEKWAADPSDDHRRAAMPAGEAAGFTHPAGTAAIAAYWSGGSMAPPDLPAVPPAEHLTATAVAAAVCLAAVLEQPHKAPEKQRQFLSLGLEVAAGTNKWK